jgi:hypothetical protein
VALGEYVSVSSQRDAEEADIEKERQMQAKGPAARAHELKELAQIYINRCGILVNPLCICASCPATTIIGFHPVRQHAQSQHTGGVLDCKGYASIRFLDPFPAPIRGLSPALAQQVAEELSAKDVIRAHARDELGIDMDELANPWQVSECASREALLRLLQATAPV